MYRSGEPLSNTLTTYPQDGDNYGKIGAIRTLVGLIRETSDEQMMEPNLFEDPKVFKAYLSGFFDGEGSFLVKARPDSRYRIGKQLVLRMEISQNYGEILKYLQSRMQVGNVYYFRKRHIYSWVTHALPGLIKFTNLLREHVVVKRDELERFRTIIALVQQKQHLNKDGLSQILHIWNDTNPETVTNPR